uniref:Deoxynucleoside kinase domain-containing protein n=1 Tax=Arion vulgaris TaxID=1028688 RepID=A0A0B6Z8N4_9EUPU
MYSLRVIFSKVKVALLQLPPYNPSTLLLRLKRHLFYDHLPQSQETKSPRYTTMNTFQKDFKDQLTLTGNKAHFTIAVEGNIGSGKSTLLQHFENLSNCEVYEEPLDKWTNVKGHNALGLLYEDPQRWSFSFNMYAQLTRIQAHMKPHTQAVKIMERSLYSTRYCFVQNDYICKTINGFEFAVLDQYFEYLVNSGRVNLDLIVYLRADPETCLERIKKRSRTEEAGVPLSFLQALHNLHDDWLIHKKYPVPAPVLVLDANYDLDKMKETYNSRSQEILFGRS